MANFAVPNTQDYIEVKTGALFAHTHYELWTFLTNLGMSAIVIFAFGFSTPTRLGLLALSALVLWFLSF